MKTLLALLVVLPLFLLSVEAQTTSVTGRKVTFTRKDPVAEHKKTFTINYPQVTASTPEISKKIESLLSYEKLFDFTIAEEMGAVKWLEEADFIVQYDINNALSLEMFLDGSGAYPSRVSKNIVINAATGARATPATEFTNAAGLASRLNARLRKEIKHSINEIKSDSENADLNPNELFRGKRFTVKELANFSIGYHGVTFHYDYNFVHVIKALEPVGEFRMNWLELKPYLKKGGLLERVATYIIKNK